MRELSTLYCSTCPVPARNGSPALDTEPKGPWRWASQTFVLLRRGNIPETLATSPSHSVTVTSRTGVGPSPFRRKRLCKVGFMRVAYTHNKSPLGLVAPPFVKQFTTQLSLAPQEDVEGGQLHIACPFLSWSD